MRSMHIIRRRKTKGTKKTFVGKDSNISVITSNNIK
ncbi:hypothetical protein VIBHAR_06504 [Vibrio campbellii ATCC BAA-1116]|uniref:Uncharacterized protein n=1 Tax=Vibrio campbellii (strain ATCC BAA-1116) TaxID=2902295 RepID=A7N8F0_VIBC1|nr:hypothetical protein VIBHAR_06504 [Vibrio campbellii ATCC BAA-1116]